MLTSLALKMLQISIETSIVIVAVWLLMPFLKKRYSSKLIYYIWLVIVIRLLLPFSFTLPNNLSLYIKPIPVESVNISANNQGLVQQGVYQNNKTTQVIPNKSEEVSVASDAATATEISNQQVNSKEKFRVKEYLYYMPFIWLLGAVMYLLHQLLAYKTFYKLINRWSRPNQNVFIASTFSKTMLELKLNKSISILTSNRISSPMLMGFLKPKLVLPDLSYGDEDLKNILKHELIHLKRKDIWYKLLLQIVIAAHWYNPIIFLLKKQTLKSIEMSCDEDVIKGLDLNSKKQYSYTILNSIIKQKHNPNVLTSYFSSSKITTKERIKNVMDQSKKRKGIIAFIIVFTCIALAGSILVIKNSDRSFASSFESSDSDEVFLNYIANLNDDGLTRNYGSISNVEDYRTYTVKSINRREYLKVYLKRIENNEGELVWTVYKPHEYVKPKNEKGFIAEAWYHAVKYHDSKTRFNLLSEELKKQYTNSNDKSKMMTDIFSSVVEFRASLRHDHIDITYTLTDLIPTYYKYQERIDFVKEDGKIVITAINGNKQVKKPIELQVQSRADATDYKPDSAKYISALENSEEIKLMKRTDLNEYNKVIENIEKNPSYKYLFLANDPESLFKKYNEALLNSDYMAMHLMSSNTNFFQEGIDIWKTVKVRKVNVDNKIIKDNKACFKITICVDDGGESELKECNYSYYLCMENTKGKATDTGIISSSGWYIVGLVPSLYNDLGFPSEEWWSN